MCVFVVCFCLLCVPVPTFYCLLCVTLCAPLVELLPTVRRCPYLLLLLVVMCTSNSTKELSVCMHRCYCSSCPLNVPCCCCCCSSTYRLLPVLYCCCCLCTYRYLPHTLMYRCCTYWLILRISTRARSYGYARTTMPHYSKRCVHHTAGRKELLVRLSTNKCNRPDRPPAPSHRRLDRSIARRPVGRVLCIVCVPFFVYVQGMYVCVCCVRLLAVRTGTYFLMLAV